MTALPSPALACLRGGGTVLVCGLPGHGKTTLATQLSRATGARVVSVDTVRAGRFVSSAEAYAMSRQHIDHYRERGPVVVEGCALSRDYRRVLLDGIAGDRVCVWFRPSEEVTASRRPHVDLDVCLSVMDPPALDEGFEDVVELEALA